MTKALLLLVCTLFSFCALAQQPLKDSRRKSHQAFLYRIPADTAEKYFKKGIPAIDHYLSQTPVLVFPADNINYDTIPIGNYLLISVVDSMIEARYYGRSAVLSYVINNQVNPQLMLRNDKGDVFTNATVTVNGKPAKLNESAGVYFIKEKKVDEALVRIELPGDTSFAEIAIERENYWTVKKQVRARFRSSTAGKIITWIPDKITRLFNRGYRYRPKKQNNYRAEGKGYVIFNKPKYFPSDTVKFKSYLLNKKGKQYKQPVEVYLSYSTKGAYVNRKLADLKPVSNGAYVYEFVTGDTLPNDTRYTLQFKNKKNRLILNGNFKIEDYLLDEVATYSISSLKPKYYANDTLQFSANAKDANGLAVMDGRVKLLLLAKDISGFYKERVFVADTLWQEEKQLAVEGETKFLIPATSLPAADLDIRAMAVFRNSNNEIQEKEVAVEYFAKNTKLDIRVEQGMIKATLYKNGEIVTAKGFMETDLMTDSIPVAFPYAGKIDPMAETYNFYTAHGEAINEDEDFDLDEQYNVTFSRLQMADSAGFVLNNPYGIPVYYSLFDKDKQVYAASSSDETIQWKEKMPVGKIYYVRWQYYWGGEQKYGNENIALLSKLASAEIGGADAVYPGQADTITVKVKDYKQRELPGVNLTAVSYNSQFAKDIYVPEPPYIQKFKGKQPILRDWYETDELSAGKKFTLGKHQGWRKQFGLDTMAYYKFLFPADYYHMEKTRIQEVLPQVAVYAVENGVPQEVYLIYVNRQLAYSNSVTDRSQYAFTVFPGYAQFMIRLRDKYILTDSVYLQPYYKHDIVFDVNAKASNFSVRDTVNYWTDKEKMLLDNQLLRVENNGRNNGGYVWQDDRAYFLGSNGDHVAGPFFTNDSLQFYKPGDFDFKFKFEPGYRYRVSPKVVRLEKIPFMPWDKKIYLSSKGAPLWPLGDTIAKLPVISYERPITTLPFLEQQGGNYSSWGVALAKIKLRTPYDSNFVFTILQNQDVKQDYRVLWGHTNVLYGVSKGNYSVVLVTANFRYVQVDNIKVDSAGTYCVSFFKDADFSNKPVYSTSNAIVDRIRQDQADRRNLAHENYLKKKEEEAKKDDAYRTPQMTMQKGSGVVFGKVTDKKGKNPIPHVTIMLKGYSNAATLASQDGSYQLRNIKAGKYVLLFSAIGYETKEINITVYENQSEEANAALIVSTSQLEEVVVVGYGVSRQKKELAYSVTKVSAMELTPLMGKVSGVTVQAGSGWMSDSASIRIRGAGSFSGNAEPLIIVDGVPVDKMPDLDPAEVANTSVLKDAAAVAIYGSRAANGVIIITTKGFAPKALREEFRDYAFWKPNLLTDKNGEVKFTVTYPDNITSWQTYVVGMDKDHHITKATKLVKSFKPVLAQLSAPQFLVEGDTAMAIGKKINYTSSPIEATTEFSINGRQLAAKTETLKANDAAISELPLTTTGTDTLSAKFSLKAANGFADGEQRKIPVLRKGTMETVGQFNVLESDTTITIAFLPGAGEVKIYAQNNTLDVLLDEINHLKDYPYYCMEQTASKLTGLLMEKKIREALKQEFKGDKEIAKLLAKVQKGQLFDGGWGWWEGSRLNITITNYITRALLAMRGDALLETNIRNSLLFLNNQLPKMDKTDLLESLYTLSEAGHDLDYGSFMKRLVFDSLKQHQQWQMLSVMQKQKMNYEKELQTLMNKKVTTIFGGLHWGEKGYWWSRNDIATTVLAYRTLGNMQTYGAEQKQMLQYFIEQRKEGYWRNTVESATILAAILPDILKTNQQFTAKPKLTITGDTTMLINKFPFAVKTKPSSNSMTIKKEGGGMVYFTAYQQVFNPAPNVVDSNFRLKTTFENKKGETIAILKAGEKAILKLEVDVLKDAEYVQLEIPVPAGCTFGNKQKGWNEYREYFRDKVVIFAEQLKKGKYTYTIELEPRYTGQYTMNPAKAELMYFPVFYGRDAIKKVGIEK